MILIRATVQGRLTRGIVSFLVTTLLLSWNATSEASGNSHYHIGPIDHQTHLDIVRRLITTSGVEFEERDESRKDLVGYIVLTREVPDPVEAQGLMADLHRSGVRDMLLLKQDVFRNRISLGVFRARESADKRSRTLFELGYPVEVRERYRHTPRFMFSIYLADSRLDLLNRLAAVVGQQRIVKSRSHLSGVITELQAATAPEPSVEETGSARSRLSAGAPGLPVVDTTMQREQPVRKEEEGLQATVATNQAPAAAISVQESPAPVTGEPPVVLPKPAEIDTSEFQSPPLIIEREPVENVAKPPIVDVTPMTSPPSISSLASDEPAEPPESAFSLQITFIWTGLLILFVGGAILYVLESRRKKGVHVSESAVTKSLESKEGRHGATRLDSIPVDNKPAAASDPGGDEAGEADNLGEMTLQAVMTTGAADDGEALFVESDAVELEATGEGIDRGPVIDTGVIAAVDERAAQWSGEEYVDDREVLEEKFTEEPGTGLLESDFEIDDTLDEKEAAYGKTDEEFLMADLFTETLIVDETDDELLPNTEFPLEQSEIREELAGDLAVRVAGAGIPTASTNEETLLADESAEIESALQDVTDELIGKEQGTEDQDTEDHDTEDQDTEGQGGEDQGTENEDTKGQGTESQDSGNRDAEEQIGAEWGSEAQSGKVQGEEETGAKEHGDDDSLEVDNYGSEPSSDIETDNGAPDDAGNEELNFELESFDVEGGSFGADEFTVPVVEGNFDFDLDLDDDSYEQNGFAGDDLLTLDLDDDGDDSNRPTLEEIARRLDEVDPGRSSSRDVKMAKPATRIPDQEVIQDATRVHDLGQLHDEEIPAAVAAVVVLQEEEPNPTPSPVETISAMEPVQDFDGIPVLLTEVNPSITTGAAGITEIKSSPEIPEADSPEHVEASVAIPPTAQDLVSAQESSGISTHQANFLDRLARQLSHLEEAWWEHDRDVFERTCQWITRYAKLLNYSEIGLVAFQLQQLDWEKQAREVDRTLKILESLYEKEHPEIDDKVLALTFSPIAVVAERTSEHPNSSDASQQEPEERAEIQQMDSRQISFLAKLPRQLSQLAEAWWERDDAEFKRVGQWITRYARTLGFPEISEAASSILDRNWEDGSLEIDRLLQLLESLYERASPEIDDEVVAVVEAVSRSIGPAVKSALPPSGPGEPDELDDRQRNFLESLPRQLSYLAEAWWERDYDDFARVSRWIIRYSKILKFRIIAESTESLANLDWKRQPEAVDVALKQLEALYEAELLEIEEGIR